MLVTNPNGGTNVVGVDATGPTISIFAGATTADEDPVAGYTSDGGVGDCDFVAVLGGDYNCTITNTDDPISFTVIKEVDNDNGGTLGPSDFNMLVTNPNGGTNFAGVDGD